MQNSAHLRDLILANLCPCLLGVNRTTCVVENMRDQQGVNDVLLENQS